MITRKIKIGKKFYSLSRSIQNIAHHSQSLFEGVISEGGVKKSHFPGKIWKKIIMRLFLVVLLIAVEHVTIRISKFLIVFEL